MKNELSAEAQALLDGAKRAAGGPSLERRARLTASVMAATVDVPPSGVVPGGSALKLFGGWVLAGLVAVWGLPLALSSDVVASAPPLSAVQPAPAAPASAELPSVLPAPEVPAPIAAPPAARPARLPRKPAVLPEAPPAAVEAPQDEEPDELTSLGLSLAALDEGRAQDALSLARSARVRFPEGTVRPELTLAEVLALCALGQTAQASAVARAMPAVDQTSLVSEKLRRSCAGAQP